MVAILRKMTPNTMIIRLPINGFGSNHSPAAPPINLENAFTNAIVLNNETATVMPKPLFNGRQLVNGDTTP